MALLTMARVPFDYGTGPFAASARAVAQPRVEELPLQRALQALELREREAHGDQHHEPDGGALPGEVRCAERHATTRVTERARGGRAAPARGDELPEPDRHAGLRAEVEVHHVAPPAHAQGLDHRVWRFPFADLDRAAFAHDRRTAFALAGAFAALGREVALVTDDAVLAPEIGTPGRFRLVDDLERAGVALHLSATFERLDPDGVVLADGAVVPAGAVIAATGRDPSTDLADELRAGGRQVDVIGDATGVFGLESGLLAAARLAVR